MFKRHHDWAAKLDNAKVMEGFENRLRACLKARGGHFELWAALVEATDGGAIVLKKCIKKNAMVPNLCKEGFGLQIEDFGATNPIPLSA